MAISTAISTVNCWWLMCGVLVVGSINFCKICGSERVWVAEGRSLGTRCAEDRERSDSEGGGGGGVQTRLLVGVEMRKWEINSRKDYSKLAAGYITAITWDFDTIAVQWWTKAPVFLLNKTGVSHHWQFILCHVFTTYHNMLTFIYLSHILYLHISSHYVSVSSPHGPWCRPVLHHCWWQYWSGWQKRITKLSTTSQVKISNIIIYY